MYKRRKLLLLMTCLMTMVISIQVFGAKQVMVQNVPVLNQHPELPTGCEATALTMVLKYYGVNITKEQVARDMPKASRPVYRDGKLRGETPNKAFIGDPFSKNGFGVFSPVILNMIESYLPGRSENLGGGSFDKVYKALDEGRPVMTWTTIGLSEPSENSRWYTTAGETVVWKVPEHAVVVVGYDDKYIYVNDPYSGTQKKRDKNLFVKRWEQMGRQAVAVKPVPPKEKVEILETRDVFIDGIQYKDLVAVDKTGEWIPLRFLEGLHGGTAVGYDPQTALVSVTVKEDYPIPSNISKWIGHNTAGKNEAIPRNINGKYYIYIELLPTDNEVITYNLKGRKVTMKYQVIDGVTYVNKDWVQKFYELDIQTTKNSPSKVAGEFFAYPY
ncbi:MAG: C39 family peptidase [Cellulosilyticaceae bacterium]